MPRTRENTAYAQRLIKEYNHARKLLHKYLKKRHEPRDVTAMIAAVIENMTNKQSKIIGYTLNTAFKAGAKEGDKIIHTARVTASTASIGFDMTKVADTHLNKITASNIGHIGKYNSALTNQFQLQYNTLLADNRLINSLLKNGWTPWLDKALEKRGVSAEVIALAKGQTTTKKIVNILEMEGIRGGKNPRQVSKLFIPHVQRFFGPEGVIINNVGKYRKVLKVDAMGNYSYVKKLITKQYHATSKSYSTLLARTSMISAHQSGRYQSLQQSGLVDHYISVSILDANTCSLCAGMHSQRVTRETGPLYHPNCACSLKPIFRKDSGIKNKDPEFYQKQSDKWFLKQHDLKVFNSKMPSDSKLKFSSLLPEDAITDVLPDRAVMLNIRKAILK
ncbi:hypothetical protein KA005_08395 [bacterium]|nr:hypothetical protein [bacterium]